MLFRSEGFQYKNGAAFVRGPRRTEFDFRDKHGDGWGSTYQVQRGRFDQIVADAAAKKGAEIRYGHTITAVKVTPKFVAKDGTTRLRASVKIHASGGGTPLGSVQFFVDGQRVSGHVALVNGVASVTVPAALTRGSHQVRAFFIGSVDYAASSSPGMLLYVH